MAETFTQKLLEFSIQLASNTQTNQPNKFSESGSDQVTITDKRASVRIQNSGAPSSSAAQAMIYGLSESIINQLSTLGMVLNLVPKNTLTIKAGDSVTGMTVVFAGTIAAAYADFSAAPDVPFIMDCQAGLGDATANAPATSFAQQTDVATIMAGFARQMNLGFENNGVSVQLPPSYFRGSVQAQMRDCADHAGINAEVVNGNVLAIWPRFGSRNTTKIPVIARPPDGSMIGYPSFTQQGILARNLFLPDIAFGGKVKLQTDRTSLQKANGIWTVYKLDLALDSQVPNGQWMSSFYCYNSDSPNPVLPPP